MYDDDALFDDTQDDEILNSKSSGSKQSFGRNRMLTPDNVPGYLRDALLRFIGEFSEETDGYRGYTTDVSEFVSVFSSFDRTLLRTDRLSQKDTALRALVSVLDEQYEGLIQRRFKAFECEAQIQSMHSNLFIIATLHDFMLNSDRTPTTLSNGFLSQLGVMAEMIQFSIADLSNKYAEACEMSGLQPDEHLIQFGVKDEADFAYALGHSSPNIRDHYKYGNVDPIVTIMNSTLVKLLEGFVAVLYK